MIDFSAQPPLGPLDGGKSHIAPEIMDHDLLLGCVADDQLDFVAHQRIGQSLHQPFEHADVGVEYGLINHSIGETTIDTTFPRARPMQDPRGCVQTRLAAAPGPIR
jgi:hypothetical protein